MEQLYEDIQKHYKIVQNLRTEWMSKPPTKILNKTTEYEFCMLKIISLFKKFSEYPSNYKKNVIILSVYHFINHYEDFVVKYPKNSKSNKNEFIQTKENIKEKVNSISPKENFDSNLNKISNLSISLVFLHLEKLYEENYLLV